MAFKVDRLPNGDYKISIENHRPAIANDTGEVAAAFQHYYDMSHVGAYCNHCPFCRQHAKPMPRRK